MEEIPKKKRGRPVKYATEQERYLANKIQDSLRHKKYSNKSKLTDNRKEELKDIVTFLRNSIEKINKILEE